MKSKSNDLFAAPTGGATTKQVNGIGYPTRWTGCFLRDSVADFLFQHVPDLLAK